MDKKATAHLTANEYPTVISRQAKPHHPVRRIGDPEIMGPPEVTRVYLTPEQQAAEDAAAVAREQRRAERKATWLGPSGIYDPESIYIGRHRSRAHVPRWNQVNKILIAFRVRETAFAELLGLNPSTVFRWQMAKTRNGGSDGMVPIKWIEPIKALARREGIVLTPRVWIPELTVEDSE